MLYSDPLISIIIPTYNRCKKLKIAIESIRNQTFDKWEAIIVDNNSSDGTKELIKSIEDSRFKFFEIDNSGIIAKSRNLGIDKSIGKYIAFLDSDDWWDPSKLQNVYTVISKGFKFVYHDHTIVNSKKFLKKKKFISRDLDKNNPYEDLILKGPCFANSSVVLDKGILLSLGKLNENHEMISWEDFDLWLRYFKKEKNFFYIKKSLCSIIIDENNNLTALKKIKNIFNFKKTYLDPQNKKFPNWCYVELFKNSFFTKDFSESIKYFSKIKFNLLNYKTKFKLISLFIFIKLRVSKKN